MVHPLTALTTLNNTRTTAETVRRWGVEIEHVNAGSMGAFGNWSLTTDESVDTPDCQCECSDCYHSCDCPNCDMSNGYDYPEHCGDCQGNELVSPVLYSPRFTDYDRRQLAEINLGISEYDREDDALGGHIHIEGRDLSINQLMTVQKIWLMAVRHFGTELTGRDFGRYAKNYETWSETDRTAERYCAVNLTNLVRHDWSIRGATVWAEDASRQELRNLEAKGAPTDHYKSTIEFRQFGTTANPDELEMRASVCRAIVDYAKSNGAIYWLARCENAQEFMEVLQPQHH